MPADKVIPIDSLVITPDTVYGPIPESFKTAIIRSGVKLKDVWGFSLDPNEPFNPDKGKYYIGIVEKTNSECLEILKEEILLLERFSDLPVTQIYAERLAYMSEGDLEIFKKEGYRSIKTHEETHKTQNLRLDSRTRLLEGLGLLNFLRESKGHDSPAAADLFNAHHKAYLLTEVQASSVQAGTDTATVQESNDYLIYWMSKTFRLFEKQGDKTNLEIIYDKLRKRDMDFSGISNADGLISRALLLSRNPAYIGQIQEGSITFNDFEESVITGLTELIENPHAFHDSITNPDYVKSLDTELRNSLDILYEKTKKLNIRN